MTSRLERRGPEWLRLFALALLAAPSITLLHELAHYLVGFVWGFPGLELRATSVPDAAAGVGIPEWQRGLKSAAGPLVNWLFVGVACLASVRTRDAVWPAIVGLVATIRPGLIAAAFLAMTLRGTTGNAAFDEAQFARSFDLPLLPIVLFLFALMVAIWWFLVSRVPSRRRLGAIAAAVLGALVGVYAYTLIFGAVTSALT